MGYFGNRVIQGFFGLTFALIPGPGAGTLFAKTAIVGGKSISIKEAPWQLLFETDEGDGVTGHCGATWIGERWILTAAHCVENTVPSQVSVYAGITRNNEAKKSNAIKVDRIIANADFPKTWKDIAVVHLAADITNAIAKPVPFATLADVKAGLTDPGVKIMMTGWGGTNRNGDLADSLQSLTTTIHDTARYVIEIAADGSGLDRGSCGGDSGGPFVVRDASGTGWIVAGISSFIASYCGDPESPSSYTRVSSFASWIQQNTGMTTGGIAETPRLREPYFTQPYFTPSGKLHLDQGRRVAVEFVNPTGAVVGSISGYYGAGDHQIMAQGLSKGIYFPRLQAATR